MSFVLDLAPIKQTMFDLLYSCLPILGLFVGIAAAFFVVGGLMSIFKGE